MREHVWLSGRYVDNVIMGVMREECLPLYRRLENHAIMARAVRSGGG